MATLNEASRQWATRPADERYLSLTDMHMRALFLKGKSGAVVKPTSELEVIPVGDTGLALKGKGNVPVVPTHWAFGQLGSLTKAPVGWLRDNQPPAKLAAEIMNFSIKRREVEDVGVLVRQTNGIPEIIAFTGPNYGRVWNADVLKAMIDEFGDGVTGHFRVPGEFGQKVTITKDNTTLYMGDRDMFVFLADEDRRIELPNRRAGKMGSFARGFFLRNSEVGAGLVEITSFFFDHVCCNRIVWGAEDVQTIKIRHTAGAPSRWLHEAAPSLRKYAASSTQSLVTAIEDTRKNRLGKPEEVEAFLLKECDFTRGQTKGILAAHMEVELRPIETRWDAVVGITEYAKKVTWQDERVKLERVAGSLMVA